MNNCRRKITIACLTVMAVMFSAFAVIINFTSMQTHAESTSQVSVWDGTADTT